MYSIIDGYMQEKKQSTQDKNVQNSKWLTIQKDQVRIPQSHLGGSRKKSEKGERWVGTE